MQIYASFQAVLGMKDTLLLYGTAQHNTTQRIKAQQMLKPAARTGG
jgi:hypothetical protein